MGKKDMKVYCSGPSNFDHPILYHSGSKFKDILASWAFKGGCVAFLQITSESWPVAGECWREGPGTAHLVGRQQ